MKARNFTVLMVLAALSGSALLAAPAPPPQAAERSELYRSGQQALDEGEWGLAIEIFREVIRTGGPDDDAASYWLVYALHKQNRNAAALRELEGFAERYPGSSWIDDAKALRIEVGEAGGVTLRVESAEDEELKLYVLSNLIHVESERVVPVLEEILAGDSSPKLKERALFVLSQSDSPGAVDTLARVARGDQNPELAIKAIEMLGLHDEAESVPRLEQIYRQSPDPRVRSKVLEALMLADADQSLLKVVRTETEPSLRLKAVEQLGLLDAVDSLQSLYRSETDLKVRAKIVEAFFLADRADILEQIATTEQDRTLRLKAIEGLGLVDEDEGVEALSRLYRKVPDAEIRVKILESFFLHDAHEPLIEVIRTESDQELRRKALEYLALIGSPEAADYLLDLLEEGGEG